MEPPKNAERRDWEVHWDALDTERSFFGSLASAVRKHLLSRAVRTYTRRYFSSEGVFVETGCGTSEASGRIDRSGRFLVGLDFSIEALRHARDEGNFDALVLGDIRNLPFRDESVDGVWNLGVMEHFHRSDALDILTEFRRVLRAASGIALLFWPPTFGLSMWVLRPFEWWKSLRSGRTFRFFPDEVFRLPSRQAARHVLDEADLDMLAGDFTPRDGFNHLVIVGRRRET